MAFIQIIVSAILLFSTQTFAQKYNTIDFGKVGVLQWSPDKPTPKNVTEAQAEAIKQGHREEMASWITIAAKSGAEIVITPEYSVVGYPDEKAGAFQTREDIRPYVETVPGPSTAYFGALAKKLGIYIHIGFAEVDPKTNSYHNTVVAMDPKGQIAGHFRKISLFGSEPKYLVPGDRYVTYMSPVGRVGLIICADVYDVKVMDQYYYMGVRKFLMGASWSIDNDAIPTFQWSAKTWGSYIASANTTDHPGSGVFEPTGRSQSVILEKNGLVYGYLPRN